jgi:hypothetical protein
MEGVMHDPLGRLLRCYHPLSVLYREPSPLEQFEQLERRKPPAADVKPLTEFDEQSRTILDIFGLGFAALALVGLFVLVATGEVSPPPPTIIADLPSGER